MRLSQAVSPSTRVVIDFPGGAQLNVMYRPSHATIAELQAMINESLPESERVAAVIKQILDLVESWDLTEEDGETIIPLEFERLRHIPINIFKEIMVAIKKDQSAGEAESSLHAG